MKLSALAAAAVMVGSIVLANALTQQYGFVPAGFGLVVTAGTYTAALALIARDVLHDAGGLPAVAAAIVAGALVSLLVAEPRLAAASAAAFALSEIADTAVYAPLREKRYRTAVLSSQLVGAAIDTAAFLTLAFGLAALTPEAFGGQLLVKVVWVAVPAALIMGGVRSALSQRREATR